jgi:hypothetical protein
LMPINIWNDRRKKKMRRDREASWNISDRQTQVETRRQYESLSFWNYCIRLLEYTLGRVFSPTSCFTTVYTLL